MAADFDIDSLEQDAAKPVQDDSGLAQLAEMAKTLEKLYDERGDMEDALKAINSRIRDFEFNRIPEKMTELRLKDYTTEDGSKVSVADVISGSVPKKNMTEASKWLRDNHHEDLIENKIELKFTRSEDEKADEIYDMLAERELPLTRSESVNHMTLKSWAREQLDNGVEIPLELLGLFVAKVAKLKKGKSTK